MVVVNVVLLVHHCCSNMACGLWECLVITPFYFSFSFNFFFLSTEQVFIIEKFLAKFGFSLFFSLIIVHMVMGALYPPFPLFFFFFLLLVYLFYVESPRPYRIELRERKQRPFLTRVQGGRSGEVVSRGSFPGGRLEGVGLIGCPVPATRLVRCCYCIRVSEP